MSKLELPITPGVYRMRGGGEAVIIRCETDDLPYPVKGRIDDLTRLGKRELWQACGRWNRVGDPEPHEYDLIERIGDLPNADTVLLSDDAPAVPASVPPPKTLLDEFAGLALQGWLATYNTADPDPNPERCAKLAYEMAAAMLSERAKYIK